MTTESVGQQLPYTAVGDLSGQQYLAVVNVAGGINLPTGITGHAIGIVQNKPKAGQGATVAISGRSKAVASGAIPVGSIVAPIANGKVQVAVSTQYALGFYDGDAAAADGDVIPIVLHPATVPQP